MTKHTAIKVIRTRHHFTYSKSTTILKHMGFEEALTEACESLLKAMQSMSKIIKNAKNMTDEEATECLKMLTKPAKKVLLASNLLPDEEDPCDGCCPDDDQSPCEGCGYNT